MNAGTCKIEILQKKNNHSPENQHGSPEIGRKKEKIILENHHFSGSRRSFFHFQGCNPCYPEATKKRHTRGRMILTSQVR